MDSGGPEEPYIRSGPGLDPHPGEGECFAGAPFSNGVLDQNSETTCSS